MGSKIGSYFVYYINCSHRKDRRDSIVSLLHREGFEESEYKRIEAHYIKENGHLGCARSHISALEDFLEGPYDFVVIMEDDLSWPLSGTMKYEFIEKAIECDSWDVFLMAGHFHRDSTIEKICNNFRRFTSITTTAFYIVRKNFCEKLLETYRESEKKLKENPDFHPLYAIDQNWKRLQADHNFYGFNSNSPLYWTGFFPGDQDGSNSDIDRN
jgi:GR25 family glycosyltransferase involved in LPS biosynthesis